MTYGSFLYLGVSHSERNKIRISYVIGNISFIDTPKVYEQGKNVEGKVSNTFLLLIQFWGSVEVVDFTFLTCNAQIRSCIIQS